MGRILLMAIQALLPVVEENIATVPKSWKTQKGRIREDMVGKLSFVNYQAKALLKGIKFKSIWLSHLIKCFKSEGCIGFST